MPEWKFEIDAITPRYGPGAHQPELLAYPGEIKITDLHGNTAEMIEAIRIVAHPVGDPELSRYFWVHHPFSSGSADPAAMINEWWHEVQRTAKRSAGIANLLALPDLPEDPYGPDAGAGAPPPPPPMLPLQPPPSPRKPKRSIIRRIIRRIRHPFRG